MKFGVRAAEGLPTACVSLTPPLNPIHTTHSCINEMGSSWPTVNFLSRAATRWLETSSLMLCFRGPDKVRACLLASPGGGSAGLPMAASSLSCIVSRQAPPSFTVDEEGRSASPPYKQKSLTPLIMLTLLILNSFVFFFLIFNNFP